MHSKLLKAKDQTRKEALNQEHKIYKNLINITKKSKEDYYKQCFTDKNNIIIIWKGIKEIILIKKTIKLHLNSNYRSISLLPNISKIIGKAMHTTRLYKFLEKYSSLYKKQLGYRNSHSTNHALLSITEKINKSLDNNEYSYGVFLDFQKAFDTVNHVVLLKKLHYGIRGITNE